MSKKPLGVSLSINDKKDMVQLHVPVTGRLHQQLEATAKKLGYASVSELVRDCLRKAIAKAKITAAEEEQAADLIRSRRREGRKYFG